MNQVHKKSNIYTRVVDCACSCHCLSFSCSIAFFPPSSHSSSTAYQPWQSGLHQGALAKDGFDYQCLCASHRKMPSHKGLMMQEQREYLVPSSWAQDMWSLYPVQPMINKYICYVEIDVKHHPKIQHINVWVFEWITEVVVQLCTGICNKSHKGLWTVSASSDGIS